MRVFVFGNPDLDFDSLPIRILSRLKELLPDILFELKDPNEEWEIPEDFVVLDVVEGIDEVKVFDDVNDFQSAPRFTLHDFDAGAYLKYLKKLGKIDKIKIIGLPPIISEKTAIEKITTLLKSFLHSN